MSDSTQQYILKQPLEAECINPESFHQSIQVFYNGAVVADFTNSLFKELFVPLDIPSIEKQVEEISDKTSARIAHDLQYEERTWDEDRAIVEGHIADLMSELKVLFGLENKETTE